MSAVQDREPGAASSSMQARPQLRRQVGPKLPPSSPTFRSLRFFLSRLRSRRPRSSSEPLLSPLSPSAASAAAAAAPDPLRSGLPAACSSSASRLRRCRSLASLPAAAALAAARASSTSAASAWRRGPGPSSARPSAAASRPACRSRCSRCGAAACCCSLRSRLLGLSAGLACSSSPSRLRLAPAPAARQQRAAARQGWGTGAAANAATTGACSGPAGLLPKQRQQQQHWRRAAEGSVHLLPRKNEAESHLRHARAPGGRRWRGGGAAPHAPARLPAPPPCPAAARCWRGVRPCRWLQRPRLCCRRRGLRGAPGCRAPLPAPPCHGRLQPRQPAPRAAAAWHPARQRLPPRRHGCCQCWHGRPRGAQRRGRLPAAPRPTCAPPAPAPAPALPPAAPPGRGAAAPPPCRQGEAAARRGLARRAAPARCRQLLQLAQAARRCAAARCCCLHA